MPIYEYQCESCGVRFERMQHITDEALCTCPECQGHVHRVFQPVGIIFKGSGFYVTDNRAKSSTAVPGAKKTDSGETSEKADKAASTGSGSDDD
jgi:putative FmdB family regulatory protein